MALEGREAIADAVNRELREAGSESELTLERRSAGGLSQETWFGRLTGPSGQPKREVVLRLPTPSSGANAIRVQRVALEAVAGRIPAPAVYEHGDRDEGPAGGPWLIMERIAGPVPVGWHEIEPSRRRELAGRAIDVLAAMHSMPAPDSLRPRSGETSPAADLGRLQRRLGRLGPLPLVIEVALRWLEEHCPAPDTAPTVVHGDYRMGNFVVDGHKIAAVLDWELATVGDPMTDLTWCFIPIWELPGIDEGPLIERYAEARGEPVDADRLHWHRAHNHLRLAYFALAGSRAFETERSDDLRLAALGLHLPVRLDRLMRTIRGEVLS